MGVGKTSAAHYVATTCKVPSERGEAIRLYFTFEDIKFSWPEGENESMTVLAQVLVAALSTKNKDLKGYGAITFPAVVERAREALGNKPAVILIVDEVQLNLKFHQRLVEACHRIMSTNWYFWWFR